MNDIDRARAVMDAIDKSSLPWRVNKDGALIDSSGNFVPLNDQQLIGCCLAVNALPALLDLVEAVVQQIIYGGNLTNKYDDALKAIREGLEGDMNDATDHGVRLGDKFVEHVTNPFGACVGAIEIEICQSLDGELRSMVTDSHGGVGYIRNGALSSQAFQINRNIVPNEYCKRTPEFRRSESNCRHCWFNGGSLPE